MLAIMKESAGDVVGIRATGMMTGRSGQAAAPNAAPW
jgi:hypothetical protein